jgi:3-oxoacid CoA-transferase B subunit
MPWTDEELAQVVAADIEDGWVVNLGIGMPTSVSRYLYSRDVLVHSENGIIGMGPPPAPGREDPDLVNAGKEFATLVPGGAYVDSIMSFALMRGGRLDLALVGAYQVSYGGDLANWKLPGRRLSGIGGVADLAVGARRLWVMTKFFAPNGQPKLVPTCTYPLTARGVVKRLYTDQGIFACGPAGPGLLRAANDVDPDMLRGTLHETKTAPPTASGDRLAD